MRRLISLTGQVLEPGTWPGVWSEVRAEPRDRRLQYFRGVTPGVPAGGVVYQSDVLSTVSRAQRLVEALHYRREHDTLTGKINFEHTDFQLCGQYHPQSIGVTLGVPLLRMARRLR